MRPSRSAMRPAPNSGPNSYSVLWCSTASAMAGSPGNSRRASAPASINAWRSAPTTSARPPVLTSGKISAATCSTFMRSHLSWLLEFVEHLSGHQRDAVFRAVEAQRIVICVLADHHAVGDLAAAVDHHAIETRAAAHLHAGQQHRPTDVRVRMHAYARVQHRAEHRARDDAAARHQRLHGHAAAVVLVV